MMRYSEPFLLSSKGSTRATAYGFSNKSVTLEGRTHVVWLDAVAQVCGRTYDHATKRWSETYYLFEGCDNHTSPALVADRDKHLHIAYGPHGVWGGWNHGRVKWAISAQPNRMDLWRDEQNFGYNATYPCLVHMPQDIDVIAYRGGEPPASVMFQRQGPLGGWTTAREIFQQEIEPQYTHVGATCACGPDGTLYLACHFYNVGGKQHPVTGDKSKMRSYGVGILKSPDLGETWKNLHGEPVAVPALYSERIAVPPFGADVRMNGLAFDSRGSLWALTMSAGVESSDILLSRWAGKDWETVNLASQLPTPRVAVNGWMTSDTTGLLHLLLTAVEAGAVADPSQVWGTPSAEVFHIVSDEAVRSFECNQVSATDETTPNWLPSISHTGPYHPVDKPVILYTHGVKGEGCSPTTETEVWCVMVE